MSVKEGFQSAFEIFMTESFQETVDASTRASFAGGYYAVELFDDGSYRTLSSGEIGNLYDSQGVILRVPILSEDEWDEDPDIRFYDNARDEMRAKFQQFMEDLNLA